MPKKTSDKNISEVMKLIRSKRTDYSTAGFKNPEVIKRAMEARQKNAKAKKANPHKA